MGPSVERVNQGQKQVQKDVALRQVSVERARALQAQTQDVEFKVVDALSAGPVVRVTETAKTTSFTVENPEVGVFPVSMTLKKS